MRLPGLPAPALLLSPQGAAEESSAARPLDLADVARRFPRHPGPTVLYINFDGWTDHDGQGHQSPGQESRTFRDAELGRQHGNECGQRQRVERYRQARSGRG